MRPRLNTESYKTYDYNLAYSHWLQSKKWSRYNAKSRGSSAFSSQPNMPMAEKEEIWMAKFCETYFVLGCFFSICLSLKVFFKVVILSRLKDLVCCNN